MAPTIPFRSLGRLLVAACSIGCADRQVDAVEGSEESALTGERDVAVLGPTATFLKTSEAQAGALDDADKCLLPAGSRLTLDGPARLTAGGHLALRIRPSTTLPNCSIPFTGAPLYVFAPHVRITETRGETRDGAAGAFREGLVSTSDGLKIRYTACARLGQADAGETVVLLHPAGANAEQIWHRPGNMSRQSVVATLESGGLCPLAIDLRGHGQSSKPTSPEAYDAKRLQMDVVETLDALQVKRAHFHGYSLGASVLIRLLPELAARNMVRSAAFGGAGLPNGHVDNVQGRDRSAAEAADARKGPAGPLTPEAEAQRAIEAQAFKALVAKAPWTQSMAPLPFEKLSFPLLGMFGDFDNPMQNTRTFAIRSPIHYAGTAVFRDRLHIGTISPLTMPKSYGNVLRAFFRGSPLPVASDYAFVPQNAVSKS